MKKKYQGISIFQKYLSIWVLICMGVGILIGNYLKFIPNFLVKFEYYSVSIPVAILIWIMIYPMMMKIDFKSIMEIKDNPKGLYLTWIINWLVKPFTMYIIAWLFFFVIFKSFLDVNIATDYLAGAILLGAAPCTAMVFVWSLLTKGNPSYTVVQVATNDLIILVAFIPIIKFLLGISNVIVPWSTLLLSLFIFIVIPLLLGIITRLYVVRRRGDEYFKNKFIKKFDHITIIGLLFTLILLFMFQGDKIIENPLAILMISIPLIIQTFVIFGLTYIIAYKLKLKHEIAAPAGMIGASNFFELAVAMAIALFGMNSPAVLVTIVGVLVEVPIMLMLVKIANKTKYKFGIVQLEE